MLRTVLNRISIRNLLDGISKNRVADLSILNLHIILLIGIILLSLIIIG
jgi:hypothetical protein